MYTLGGSFWEFGEPDWEHTRFFMMFGVAEDHDSNPIKIALSGLRRRGAKFVSVNPVRTGYSAIADEWVGIRPGTDGLFVLALIHELLEADRIDLDYLVRYTNAAWLVIQAPGAADDGLFARNEAGRAAWCSKLRARWRARWRRGPRRALSARLRCPTAGARSRYFSSSPSAISIRATRPKRWPETCGVPAATIRRLAAEIAQAAFEEEIELPVAWTDWAGRRHDSMRGRPVSLHAMRGISAHSNGFQTCRALHLLQMLLGTIDVPGGWRYKSPHPKPCPPGPKPAGKPDQLAPGQAAAGDPARLPDVARGSDRRWRRPARAHRQGVFVGRADRRARHDAYGHRQCVERRSVPDRHALYVHGQRGLELGDEHRRDDAHADRQGPGDRRLPHSADHLFRCILFRDRRLCRFGAARHDLSRTLGLHFLARPADRRGRRPGRCDPPAGPRPRPRRPPVPGRADRTGRAARAARLCHAGRASALSRRLSRLYRQSRAPARGRARWAAGAARKATRPARGAPNPHQLERYVANGCFWKHRLPADQLYFKHANKAYLETAVAMGFIETAAPIVLQLYVEPLQRFRLAAHGHGRMQPPETHRERIATYFDPLPFWYMPFEEARVDRDAFPLHALTQRPMHMYHSWHSQNAWLRQILGHNRLFVNRAAGRALGLDEDDWVWVSSHHGRIRVPTRLMDGVNPDTVWTWNAIGKRAGAWNLDPNGPEFRKGFLLNHLISELLPADGGYRYANADPITGQAAWYDLRVRIERAPPIEAGTSEPSFSPLAHPRSLPQLPQNSTLWRRRGREAGRDLVAGAAAGPEKARPRHRPRYLRRLPCLRHRVQGMEQRRAYGAAPRFRPLWRECLGGVVQPHPFLRRRRRRRRADGLFPTILPALRGTRLRHGVSDRRLLQARRGWDRAGRRIDLHRLQAVLLGVSLWRPRIRCRRRRHEEMHLMHRPHLQRKPAGRGSPAGLRHGVPGQCPAFRRSRRS